MKRNGATNATARLPAEYRDGEGMFHALLTQAVALACHAMIEGLQPVGGAEGDRKGNDPDDAKR